MLWIKQGYYYWAYGARPISGETVKVGDCASSVRDKGKHD